MTSVTDSLDRESGSTLYAVFDMSKADTPYDLPLFLTQAEARRIAVGKGSIFLHVVLGKNGDSSDGGFVAAEPAIFGFLGLLKSVGGYCVVGTRRESIALLRDWHATDVFSNDPSEIDASMSANIPTIHAGADWQVTDACSLEPSKPADDYVKRWLESNSSIPRKISLTIDGTVGADLRAGQSAPDWWQRCRYLVDDPRYQIVLAPLDDHAATRRFIESNALDELPGAVVSPDLRTALYSRCDLNIFYGSTAARLYRAFAHLPVLLISDEEESFQQGQHAVSPPDATPEALRDTLRAIEAAVTDATRGCGMNAEVQIERTIDEAYDLAVELLRFNPDAFGKAIAILKDILLRDPDNARAAAMLGVASHKFRRHTEAISLLKHAILCDGSEPTDYFNLAAALFALSRDEEALNYLKVAVSLDPNFIEAYDLLGLILRRNGELEPALEAMVSSEKLRNVTTSQSFTKAEILFDLGDCDRALAVIRRATERWMYQKTNRRASAIMIWPWRARFYATREAKFPFNLQDDV